MERRPATPAEAKALAHPLRLRILRLCLDEPLTNKQLAERLGKDPGTTLYHVRTLVDTGFLAPEEVRVGSSGALERPYRATGKSWTVDVAEGGPGLAVGTAALEAFRAEVYEAGDQADLTTTRAALRLAPAARAELLQRLAAVADEFSHREEPAGEPLGLFIGLHRRVVGGPGQARPGRTRPTS